MEDQMVELTQSSHVHSERANVKRYSATVVLSYVALSILILTEIYLASLSSGTAASEFASMAVFP
jgi:hypothetical protein